MRLRGLVFSVAIYLGLAAAAAAVEPSPGSRNFTPPGNVPNYFNNEAGAIRGTTPPAAMPGTTYAVPSVRRRHAAVEPRHSAHRAGRGHGRHRAVHARSRTAHARASVTRGGRGGSSHAAVRHASAGRSGSRVAHR